MVGFKRLWHLCSFLVLTELDIWIFVGENYSAGGIKRCGHPLFWIDLEKHI